MKKTAAQENVYQFKITLVESKPPIWRRIQVRNCTLDKLHEAIQTAMGWTNSHLHHFTIEDGYYGDPDLVHEDSGDIEYEDSTRIKVADILPDGPGVFCFEYEYDFGDGWTHEIQFEGVHPREEGVRYPRCLEQELRPGVTRLTDRGWAKSAPGRLSTVVLAERRVTLASGGMSWRADRCG